MCFDFQFLLYGTVVYVFLNDLLKLGGLLRERLSTHVRCGLSVVFLTILVIPFLPVDSTPSSVS